MSRPADWSILNHWSDPVPGSPSGVERASKRYLTIADSIADAKLTILGVFDNDELVGDSIDAVREVALDVADRIGRAKERYVGVGNALAVYVQPLEDAQRDSENILNAAIAARDERDYAEGRVYYWERELDEAVAAQDTARSTKAEDKIEQWRGELYGASNTINSAVQNLQAVIDARNAAANRAADAIEKVENTGGLNDDFWNNVDQWFEENPWINEAITIAGYIAAALAIVAMFVPGLNLIIAIVIGVIIAATVLNAVLQAMTGNKPWGQALFEIAMALIPLGVGKVLGKAFTAIASKVKPAAIVSLIKSGNRLANGTTADDALLTIANQLAGKKPWLQGDAGMLADAALLAKMTLSSGNTSVVLTTLGDSTKFLFGSMVVNELAPVAIDLVMKATETTFGDLPGALGDFSIDDRQDHHW